MGYITRELESGPLSSIYPSCYTETQWLNWCPVDVVITDNNGRQDTLPRWPKAIPGHPHVSILQRHCNGPRVNLTKTGPQDVKIPAKEFTINYEEFSSYPVRVDELGIIVSTKEMSLVAKGMTLESGYRYNVDETYADCTTLDPRLVFEVKDPFNRWEYLFVNVFGQTIQLRCGHRAQMIPDLTDSVIAQYNAESTLSCYLRYPSNYIQDTRDTVPVFTINLVDIDKGEPYHLPTGDVVCVASSEEGLRDVLARRHVGSASPNFAALGMVSKDVHDRLVKQLTDRIEQERNTAADQLRAMRAKHEAETASCKAEMDKLKRDNEILSKQVEYFGSIQKSISERAERDEKFAIQREKARAEEYEANQRSLDRTYSALKIGGTIIAGVLSFALTLYAKKK